MADCWLSEHSAEETWVTSVSANVVEDALRSVSTAGNTDTMVLREPTSYEKRDFYGNKNGKQASVQVVRISPKASFRDFIAFYVSPISEDGGTRVFGRGQSLDYHVWTACPCCTRLGLCRYVACFFCCCGVCPTKDWGQNMRTLEYFARSAGVGLKVENAGAPLNNLENSKKYESPRPLDASR